MGTDGQSRGADGRRRPRRKGPGLALAAFLGACAFAGNALATHPSWREQLELNIDADRAGEVVTASYDVSSDHRTERGTVYATDRCAARRVRVALIPAGMFRPRFALRPTHLARAAVGFLADYRGGPRVARVVRLRNCRTQVLLAFSSPVAAKLELEARNHTARYPGREVVVVEGLRDAARRHYFRYAPARARYVKYRTTFSAA